MNKIKYFLILLITAITFASCSTTYASAQSPYEYDDTYTTPSVTFSTVVRYGTPYYIDNVLSYYYIEVYIIIHIDIITIGISIHLIIADLMDMYIITVQGIGII